VHLRLDDLRLAIGLVSSGVFRSTQRGENIADAALRGHPAAIAVAAQLR